MFASDPKAVLELVGRAPRIDVGALVGDLVYGYQLESNTVFSGVRMLPPASYLLIDRTGRPLEEAVYWKWRPAERPRSGGYEDYLQELEASLRTVVRRRLISDRPLGVLLSGGVDSSLTAAIAAQEAGREVDAYTIEFDDGAFDESPHARAVAEKVGLRHHVLPSAAARLDHLPRLLWHYGVPFHDFSCIPTAAAFEAVSTKCVVCLTGDGGDEMFAGYTEPLLFRWLSDYSRIPSALRGISPRGPGTCARARAHGTAHGEVVQAGSAAPRRVLRAHQGLHLEREHPAADVGVPERSDSRALGNGRGLPGNGRWRRAALSAGQCRHSVRQRLSGQGGRRRDGVFRGVADTLSEPRGRRARRRGSHRRGF